MLHWGCILELACWSLQSRGCCPRSRLPSHRRLSACSGSVLAYHPGNAALQVVSDQLEQHVDELSSQDIGNFVWACAKLTWRPPKPCMAAMYDRMELILPHTNAQALANLMWASAVS